jgi:MFS family permease
MKEIKVLMFVNLLCATAGMAFMPIMGPIFRNLGLQDWHAGATVTLGGIAWIYFARFWGKKSDAVGRKPILLLSVGGVSFSYLILALFIDYALATKVAIWVSLAVLVFARTSMSIFYAAMNPVSSALVADKIEPKLRASAMAKLGGANGLGMILGPIAGGMLAVYGLSTPLYTFAILPFFAVIVLYLSLEHLPKPIKQKQEHFKLFDSRTIVPMSATFIAMFAFMSVNTCMSFLVMDRYLFDDTQTAQVSGYVLAIIGFSFIFSQIIVSKKTDVSPKIWLILGNIMAIVGLIGISFIGSKIGLYVSAALFGLSMGFIFPSVMAITANSVKHTEQGAAAGTVSSAQGLGMMFAPLVSTLLYEIWSGFPFIFAGILYIGMLLLVWKKVNA